MLTSIFLLIFQGISGGVSGYITNKYAVDMLFKEYTPLKLGGVIKKKKEKFIEEMSELVERDVINSQTLKAQISSKNFNTYIEKIAETVFKKGLKSNLENIKISEIPGFSSTVAKSEEFAIKNLNLFIPEILDNIANNIKLDNIITDEQVSKIAKACYDLLTEEIETNSSLEEFVYSLYKENEDITLSTVFSDDMQKKLTTNIIKEVKCIINENILNNEEKCKVLIDKLLLSANVDLTLTKVQGLIGDYELNQIFNKSDEKEFSVSLFKKINEFIKSENGKNLLESLTNDIILIGKDIEFTLYEILPSEIEESLTEFIRIIIPKVMPYISEWISSNKDNLDEMIEEAIDEAIQGVDENIKKLIISKVRTALMGDISSKNNIVSKVIDYLNNNFNEESYGKLADYIIAYLKETKVKDIIINLENKNLINLDKLVKFLTKEFELHGEKLISKIIKSQFSKKIHKIFNLDLVKLFNEKFKPTLYKNIFDNKDNIAEKLNYLIDNFVNSKIDKIFNTKLSDLISEDSIKNYSKDIGKLTHKYINTDNSIVERQISDYIRSEVKKVDLSLKLKEYKVDISRFIVDKSIGLMSKTVDNYKNYELKQFVNMNFTKKQLSDILINEGYPLLINKLPGLVDGKIKEFVKNNLNKYNEDEICDIVQDFMGNQLKPLSVFGAFLGVIVGVVWQLLYPISTLGNFGFPNNIVDGLISCGVMAFIGIITNVIALWMIFHPYKENKIAAKIPFIKNFATGYIPAHKNEFALGMAKLIEEQLLNKEEINKTFELQKHKIQTSLMHLVKNNGYQILIEYVRNKKSSITNYVYKKILKYSDENSDLSRKLSKLLGEVKVNKILKEESVFDLSDKVINNIIKLKDGLVKLVQNKISSNNKVNILIPKALVSQLDEYVEGETSKVINEKIEAVGNLSFVKQYIYKQYEDKYNTTIEKSCEEIFDKELLVNIKNQMSEKVCNYFYNDFKYQAASSVKEFLSNELDENKDIGSMFDGKIKTLIEDNLYPLTNLASNKVLTYLQKYKFEITLEVQETIKDGLNFFEKIAYASFGGDEIAGRVVEIILSEKLPIMFKYETDSMVEAAKAAFKYGIYPVKMSSLKIKADDFNIAIIIDNISDKLNRNIESKEYISRGVTLILESISSTPIIDYLKLCNLNSLELIYNKFNNEFRIIEEDIYNNIKNNSTVLSKELSGLLKEEIIVPLLNCDNSIIFNEIKAIEIEKSVSNILNLVTLSKETKKYLNRLLENIHKNTISKLSIEEFVDMDLLNKDINNVIKNIFGNNEIKERNVLIINQIVNNAVDDGFDFISDETKDYLLNKTIEIGLYSTNEHIIPVVQEVDLRDITLRQMDLLNPKEIDVLFNSFAGDLFYKLKLYGVFGFVFGINVWLSIILLALDIKHSSVKELGVKS